MSNEMKKGGGAGAAAIAPAQSSELRQSTGGVFENVNRLAQAIKAMGEKFNLVVPGGAIGNKLPLLHAAGISFVFVDPQHEAYKIPGRSELGIGKNALDRIAAAAGVRWIPQMCGRVDDGSNPHFIEYQAAGTTLQLDGTERTIHATKRIDLRADKGGNQEEWGTDAANIARIAAKANPPRDPWSEILQTRQHILSLAETKAKNRAIRSLGVRTAYAPQDLDRGFAVVRLQFTGHSEDPEIEHEVSLMIARRALQATDALYGGVRQQIAPEHAVQTRAVPRIVKESEPEAEEEAPESNGSGTGPCQPAEFGTQAAPKSPADDPSLICGNADKKTGEYPHKKASEFSASELRSKIKYYEDHRSGWKPEWADKNEKDLLAMKAWLAFKEFDPQQGNINFDKTAKPGDDRVPFRDLP